MTNRPSKNILDTLERQAKLTSICAGWNIESLHKNNLSNDSLFFYIMNAHSSKDLWVCSIPRSSFNSFIASSPNITTNEAASGVSHFFDLVSKKTETFERDENLLALSLSLYLSKTKTFQIALGDENVRHFCFVRYKKTNNLRPFALNGSGFSFLVAADVMEAFGRVLEIDSRNHPEWMG